MSSTFDQSSRAMPGMNANLTTRSEQTKDADTVWSVADSTALYRVNEWSDRFFHINELGHAAVHTARTQGDNESESIDISEVVQHLRGRGVQMPCLLRLHDV